MLARLDMRLGAEIDEISYQMSSTFHGALMEMLKDDYAQQLHESKRHPYTQHIEKHGKEWHWIVTALNEDTAHHMLQEVLIPISSISVKKHQLIIQIVDKMYQEMTERELSHSFYQEQANRYITIRFVTPTAFKQNGVYINYPNIRMIYSNIMKAYDAVHTDEKIYDEDTLEQLVESTALSRYELRSTSFSLEGIRIPSFLGRITLKMNGTQTMANFAQMLFSFSSYSGIGIKTALGMGAIKINDERKGDNARQTN